MLLHKDFFIFFKSPKASLWDLHKCICRALLERKLEVKENFAILELLSGCQKRPDFSGFLRKKNILIFVFFLGFLRVLKNSAQKADNYV